MTVGASLRPEGVHRSGVRPPSAEALSSWKVVRLPSALKRFNSDMLACRGQHKHLESHSRLFACRVGRPQLQHSGPFSTQVAQLR